MGSGTANLVYKRVSTDQQSTDRQNLVLDEAGIEDPVVLKSVSSLFALLLSMRDAIGP